MVGEYWCPWCCVTIFDWERRDHRAEHITEDDVDDLMERAERGEYDEWITGQR